jgi:putative ABC transport system substrate-binding protein
MTVNCCNARVRFWLQVSRDLFARQTVDILRGSKPGEIPVEQPTRFELVVNFKAANAIGVKIPSAFAIRADAVIEGPK